VFCRQGLTKGEKGVVKTDSVRYTKNSFQRESGELAILKKKGWEIMRKREGFD